MANLVKAEHSLSAGLGNPEGARVMMDIADKVDRGANIVPPVNRNVPFRHWKAKMNSKIENGEISIGELNVSEQYALRIENVIEQGNKLCVHFEDGRSIDLYFNGCFEKYTQRGRGLGITCPNINMKRARITFDIKGKKGSMASMFLERAMMIAWSVLMDSFPEDLNSLEANVMDASGNFHTARKLGIKPNFHPENIEWSLGSRNSAHDDTVIKITEKTGHVYRISANDNVAEDLARTEDNIEVINYYLDLIGAVRVR